MVKISSAYAFAVSALLFFNSLVSCAYGHSLIFGPEFFSSQNGQPQKVVKRFSVRDVNQKFIVSVQSGKGGENGMVRGSIHINGKLIFSLEEIGKQAKMLAKPVKLKKQNNISVDVAGEAAAPIIVTIMSLVTFRHYGASDFRRNGATLNCHFRDSNWGKGCVIFAVFATVFFTCWAVIPLRLSGSPDFPHRSFEYFTLRLCFWFDFFIKKAAIWLLSRPF